MTNQNTAPTFSVGNGIVNTPVGSGSAIGNSVTMQTDGKILVAGSSWSGENNNFALTRYNSDGSLDATFDVDGIVTTIPAGSDYGVGNSVAVQTDGKILVAGYAYNRKNGGNGDDFALARYNSDGSLDLSFDADGSVVTPVMGSSEDIGKSVKVQADGKILVAGFSVIGKTYDFAVTRYNNDGSLDTFFDSDGIVTTPIGLSDDFGNSVTIQADGKILVAGSSLISGHNAFSLVRYNNDGSLDTTFDTDGIVTTLESNSDLFGKSVAVQSDGKILVAGSSKTGESSFAEVLTRYNNDGSLDTTFDADGKVVMPIRGWAGDELGNSLTIQANGKILVTGSSSGDPILTRYNNDGSLDTTFGTDGKVTAQTRGIGMSSITVQNDGKILIAGSERPDRLDYSSVMRYNGDGSVDLSFNPINTLNSVVQVELNKAVIIAPDVEILDTELYALGNYNNAHLSLQRHGTVIESDSFGVNYPISSANDLGTSIGTATQNNGKLDLTFNSNATQSVVTTTLRSLTYTNVGNGESEKITLDWTFNDGNTGSQGGGGVGVVTGTSVINITDLTPPYPAYDNFIPALHTTNVTLDSNIMLPFTEAIQRGVGSIILKNSLGTVIATYDAATSSNLSITGNTLTINPSSDFEYSTRYIITIPRECVKDMSGNFYSGSLNYEFTTKNPNSLPTGSITIIGNPVQGQMLSADYSIQDADGLDDSIAMNHQWLRNREIITGANENGYTLTVDDIGKTISLKLSYIDFGNNAESITSNSTELVIPAANHAPTGSVVIMGVAKKGQTLTVSGNVDDVDGMGNITGQWFSNGVAVSGASEASYFLTQVEVGKSISATVSYTDGLGKLESVTSTGVIISNVNNLPTGSVNITGTPTQNQVLTASNSLADADGLGSTNSQWLRNDQPINGATQAVYTLTTADIGKAISVRTSYTDLQGTAESVTSSVTDLIEPAAPTYSLTANQNQMDEGTFVTFNLATTNLPQNSLVSFDFGGSVTDEDITGNLPESSFTVGTNGKASLTMKLMNDKTTEGSENLTLTLNDDITQTVSIIVNDTSIAVNHKPTGTALIKGDVKVGSILTLTNTIKDADGLGDFSFQWETSAGILSSNESVTLTAKELGQQVWAAVSYTDHAGNLESVESKLTATVTIAKVSTVSSEGNDLLTGTAKSDKLLGLAGNDTLIGGLSADTLTGGKGADIFKFNKVGETGINVKTRDTITDFKTTEGDKIDLSGIDANSKLTGNQAFNFIGNTAFSTTDAAGQLRFDATSHILYGSTNADNKPEFSIQLNGVSSLVIGDFIL